MVWMGGGVYFLRDIYWWNGLESHNVLACFIVFINRLVDRTRDRFCLGSISLAYRKLHCANSPRADATSNLPKGFVLYKCVHNTLFTATNSDIVRRKMKY